MSGTTLTSATAFSPSLEAIKLAASMYNAAREGNKSALEEAILDGLPPNLTNEKGDTLVSAYAKPPMSPCRTLCCLLLVLSLVLVDWVEDAGLNITAWANA